VEANGIDDAQRDERFNMPAQPSNLSIKDVLSEHCHLLSVCLAVLYRVADVVTFIIQTLLSTVGDDLEVVEQDRLIKSDPADYKRRRTVAIERAHGGSCGFTLQVSACYPYPSPHQNNRPTLVLSS